MSYLFGLVSKSSYINHWATNPLVYYPFPGKIMYLNRFSTLKKYICFYDVSKKNDKKDPSFKIHYFIDYIIKKS